MLLLSYPFPYSGASGGGQVLHLCQCHALAPGEQTRVGFSSALSKSVWLIISARPLKKNDLQLQKVSQTVSLSKSSSGTAGLGGLCPHAAPQQGRFGFRAGACLLWGSSGSAHSSIALPLCPPPAALLCQGGVLRTVASLNSADIGAVTPPRQAAAPACASSAMFMQSSVNSSQRFLGLQFL